MEPEHQITFGPFRLEMTQGRLWRGDQVMPLRPRSLVMLRCVVNLCPAGARCEWSRAAPPSEQWSEAV
jgi:hypothetical protein